MIWKKVNISGTFVCAKPIAVEMEIMFPCPYTFLHEVQQVFAAEKIKKVTTFLR